MQLINWLRVVHLVFIIIIIILNIKYNLLLNAMPSPWLVHFFINHNIVFKSDSTVSGAMYAYQFIREATGFKVRKYNRTYQWQHGVVDMIWLGIFHSLELQNKSNNIDKLLLFEITSSCWVLACTQSTRLRSCASSPSIPPRASLCSVRRWPLGRIGVTQSDVWKGDEIVMKNNGRRK